MVNKLFKLGVYIFAFVGFVLVATHFSVKLGLTNTNGIIDNQRKSFLANSNNDAYEYSWIRTYEWQVLREAIQKDTESINKAASLSGVDPRLIISMLVPEQLRLFNDNREIFKQIFAPLKVLGNQSQFSWGVMGLKRETAIEIEQNLKDTNSPFYLGKEYENILDFKTSDHGQERFARITDENDRYYSYLYVGLYLKQIITQWSKAGYDISTRPEILATLYNIGFKHSVPKTNPSSGGAEIEIGGDSFSFGTLAFQFYNSNELIDIIKK